MFMLRVFNKLIRKVDSRFRGNFLAVSTLIHSILNELYDVHLSPIASEMLQLFDIEVK